MSLNGNDLTFTGERFVPGIDDYKLEMEHIQRYRMAKLLTENKTVLDAACGEGYGSALLAENAKQVIGVDISEESISHARYRYSDKENLQFEVKDISHLNGVETGSMDVVVSFETIEHISKDTQKKFLKEIKRVLKKDGLLIMSTPNKKIYSDMFDYHNEYHVHEFDQNTYISFLKTQFRTVKLVSQSFEVNCLISDDKNKETAIMVQGNRNPLKTCKFFIALATNGSLPKVNLQSVFLGNYGEYNERILRLLQLQKEEDKRNEHIKKLDSELEEKGAYIFQLQKELEEKEMLWNQRVAEAHDSLQILSEQFTEKIQTLQAEKDEKEQLLLQEEKKISEITADCQQLKEYTDGQERELTAQKEIIRQRESEIESISQKMEIQMQQYESKLEEIRSQKEEAEENAEEIKNWYQSELEHADEQTEAIKKEKENCEAEICKLQEEVWQALVENDHLYRNIEEKEKEKADVIQKFEQILEEKEKEINDRLEQSENRQRELEEKDAELKKKCAETEELNQKIEVLTASYEDKQKELNQQIRNRDGHIEQLLEKEREFNRIRETRSYKIGLKIHAISEVVLPGGSTRRFVFGTVCKIIFHPIKMIRFLNPHRIRKFFWLYRMGGMDAVQYRFRVLEANELVEHKEEENVSLPEVTELTASTEEYEKIEFENYMFPEVSIVIPVYNQFAYTYECLKSIRKNTEGVSYEVIIADDNSDDLTADIKKIVKNIRVIKNHGTKGFLPNCNNAAEHAKGKYILFLNNDTQVQENWLKPMADLLAGDEKIGMTGGKLIYPNGMLQEAGGILWKDGSAWNYGNQKSPEDPEYNYVREVDYISGAAIMIRKSLWDQIGGFDRRFTPAYYEDTDLAFQVRERGYKVVYQPKSVVVHFEGISNGTDVTAGLKAYQVENQKKFFEKWKDVLEKDHFENGQNIFLAKDRSRYKKQILVVDHYVPHFDNDAGGRCTFMWIKMFVKLGLKVTFIGDNFYKHEPYTTILNQLGIEVLYGNFYYNNYKGWLKENLHYFDYIYLQRPHISIKYIDLVKEYGRGKVFYFAHDLHFLRLNREYALTGNEQAKRQAEDIKKTEMYLFEKADVVHVVGSYEQQLLQQELPEKTIRNIPLYIYEDMPKDICKNFVERKDLIFVGGFGHPPNVDAVLWFAKKIFPVIKKEIQDITWHIVGGKVPDEIQKLNGDDIIIHGFVSDEQLETLYRECRLAVVPLRVGAGVKGKVVEAAYYQIPLVTTSIGGEGISHEFDAFVMEDDADKMADLILNLYQDYDRLKKMSDDGIKLIQKYYTLDSAERTFVQDM